MNQADDTLLPYQKGWLQDTARVRVAEKSRRIGWSWTAAAESVADAMRSAEAGGCDVWYIGYNREMAQEFVRDCAMWARAFALTVPETVFGAEGEDKSILTYAVHFASGFRITALSSRPTNLRGKQGHVILDEAAFHDDLQGLIKAAMATKMWGRSARIDIISSDNGVESQFNKLLDDIRAGKLPYSLHRCTLDDALAQGLYKRICAVNNIEWTPEREAAWRAELFASYGDAAQEELLCIPARSGGQYIPRDLSERQMKPGFVARLALDNDFMDLPEQAANARIEEWCFQTLGPLLAELPKDREHYLGEDFGRSADRTVLVPGYIAKDLTRKTPFVVELFNVPFREQEKVANFVMSRLPRLIKAAFDATGNGQGLAEAMQRSFGEKVVECVKLTEAWYAKNLPLFKAALTDGSLELVKDADHLVDLSAFKVVDGLPKLPKSKTASALGGAPRHGDAGVAYVLAHYASRVPVVEYAYQGIKRTEATGKQLDAMRAVKASATGLRARPGGLF